MAKNIKAMELNTSSEKAETDEEPNPSILKLKTKKRTKSLNEDKKIGNGGDADNKSNKNLKNVAKNDADNEEQLEENFCLDDFELIEFTDMHKQQMISLLNAFMPEFEPLKSLYNVRRSFPRLACLVQFFNDYFRVYKLWPLMVRMPVEIRTNKSLKDLESINDKTKLNQMLNYFRFWFKLFYISDEIIESLDLEPDSVEMITIMILNVFYQVRDSTPQLRFLLNVGWSLLQPFGEKFFPVFKHDKISTILLDQLVQERLWHQVTRQEQTKLEQELSLKKRELDELRSNFERMKQSINNRPPTVVPVASQPKSILNPKPGPSLQSVLQPVKFIPPAPKVSHKPNSKLLPPKQQKSQLKSILLAPSTNPVPPTPQVSLPVQPPPLPQPVQVSIPLVSEPEPVVLPSIKKEPETPTPPEVVEEEKTEVIQIIESPPSSPPSPQPKKKSETKTRDSSPPENSLSYNELPPRKRGRPKKLMSPEPEPDLIETRRRKKPRASSSSSAESSPVVTVIHPKPPPPSTDPLKMTIRKKVKKISLLEPVKPDGNVNQSVQPPLMKATSIKSEESSLLENAEVQANNTQTTAKPSKSLIIKPLNGNRTMPMSDTSSTSSSNNKKKSNFNNAVLDNNDSTPSIGEQLKNADIDCLVSFYNINSSDQVTCRFCNQTSNNLEEFREHLYQHKGKLYPCKFCQKVFSNRYKLTRHLPCHTGEKPFNCKQCPRSFARSDKLNDHVRAIHWKNGHPTPKTSRKNNVIKYSNNNVNSVILKSVEQTTTQSNDPNDSINNDNNSQTKRKAPAKKTRNIKAKSSKSNSPTSNGDCDDTGNADDDDNNSSAASIQKIRIRIPKRFQANSNIAGYVEDDNDENGEIEGNNDEEEEEEYITTNNGILHKNGSTFSTASSSVNQSDIEDDDDYVNDEVEDNYEIIHYDDEEVEHIEVTPLIRF